MSKKYLLDTNICVHLLRGKYHVDTFMDAVGFNNCYISEITMAELKYGSELGRQMGYHGRNEMLEAFLSKINILPIINVLDLFASEKARLRLAGTPADDNFDLLIGCTSVYYKMIMVTENFKDFKNIKNIKLDNWIKR